MISQGDIHNYKNEDGDVLISFRLVGEEHQVCAPGGNWETISPSIKKPNAKSKALLLDILRDVDTVSDFMIVVSNKIAKRGKVAPSGQVSDFPLTLSLDKNGQEVFKSKQVLFHCVEKIAKSNERNTIAKGQYLTIFDDKNVRTLDITMPEFYERVSDEVVNLKLSSGIADADLLPTTSVIRENITNISRYLMKVCKVDPSAEVDIRLSSRDGYVIYDTLSDQVLKIDADTIEYVPMPPGLLRMPGMLPLGEIDLDADMKALRLLEPRMPFSLWGKAQHLAWLLTMAFDRLEGANTLIPIEVISGPQGTSKTSGAEVTLSVIDPHQQHVVNLAWDKVDELAINLSRNKFVIWDNLSGKIKDEVSNMLCTTVTGGSFEKRKLYSDSLVTSLPLRGKPIITTVGLRQIKPDLQERLIYITAKKFEHPVSMVLVKRYMNEHGPAIRGAYVKLIQQVLRDYPERLDAVIKADIQGRLVEYAAIGDIMLEQFGARKGLFIDAYKEYLIQLKNEKAEQDNLAQQVMEYINGCSIGLDRYTWVEGVTKTSKEWAALMNLHYGDKAITSYAWKRAMDNCADVLSTLGVTVTPAKRCSGGSGTNFTITYIPQKELELTAIEELERFMSSVTSVT